MKKFLIRLTRWLNTEKEARNFADNFFKRQDDCEGKTYKIVSIKDKGGMGKKYAIFKKAESYYRDKDYEIKIPLYHFLLKNIYRKRDGISILKTTNVIY